MKKLVTASLVSLFAVFAVPAFADAGSDAIRKAIASPQRTDADRGRDAREKPAEVLALAGVKPGMTVADIFSGGGYYTELLSGVVGPNGKVYAINNVPYLNYSKKGIEERFKDGRLENVEPRVVEASYMNLPPKSVDVAIIVMSFHDVFWIDEKEGWPEISVNGFCESVKRMLKPGGRLLIIDHDAPAGSGREMAGKAHRLNEEFAKKTLTSNGFVLEKTWDGLRNSGDQLDKMVFDPAVRGKTDRYVHLYTVK